MSLEASQIHLTILQVLYYTCLVQTLEAGFIRDFVSGDEGKKMGRIQVSYGVWGALLSFQLLPLAAPGTF